jgi:hypothetical protein
MVRKSQDLLRVLLELKAHDRVVRKADHECTTSQSRFDLLSEPLVENVMEIGITVMFRQARVNMDSQWPTVILNKKEKGIP